MDNHVSANQRGGRSQRIARRHHQAERTGGPEICDSINLTSVGRMALNAG